MKSVMYHYVRPDDPRYPHFRHLRVSDFRAQLDHFRRWYYLPSRDEFLAAIAAGVAIPNSVVLTFDDGLRDHFEYVYPELRRRGLWGIFYISTAVYQQTKPLDVHRIHLLLGRFGGRQVYEALVPCIENEMLSDRYVEEFRRMTYRHQHNDDFTLRVKRTLNYFIDYDSRSQVIDAVCGELRLTAAAEAGTLYLQPEELRAMQRGGMLVGSHTVNHRVMSKLSSPDQEREIVDSFDFLEGATGGLTARTFCYPYGGFHTFTAETEQMLSRHGCVFSFNVEPRRIDARDLVDRPQALPRYDCNFFPHGSCRTNAA